MPLAIDLYCGLGGWTEGLLAEGYDVVGFDIERHQYGAHRYPAQLVVQDVLTLHGSQFRDATLIVASPPCQEYSYMAMPWKLAKAKAAAIRADTSGQMLADLNRLFEACFRIQAEASLAAGRHIPMVVENVRGAQPWVGRAHWNFGSFYLWGDVPALMPFTASRVMKYGKICHTPADWERVQAGADIPHPHAIDPSSRLGQKVPGFRFDGSGRSFQSAAVKAGGFETIGGNGRTKGHWTDPTDRGVKHHGSGAVWFDTGPASLPSSSPRRKAASAMIARIPLPLSRHIAAVYR